MHNVIVLLYYVSTFVRIDPSTFNYLKNRADQEGRTHNLNLVPWKAVSYVQTIK